MRYVSHSREAIQRMRKPIVSWLYRNALRLESETIKNAPKGASGTLRKGIIAFIDEIKLIGGVGIHPVYSKFVAGVPVITKRHFLPWSYPGLKLEMFRRWGNQRGFDTTRGGLLVWGYRNTFFADAIAKVANIAMAELRSMRI